MKNLIALIAVGLVLGVVLGFGGSKVFSTVKTKTVKVAVPVKITNGEDTRQMVKSFGSPAQILAANTKVTLPKGCALFQGATNPATNSPKWGIVVCAFAP